MAAGRCHGGDLPPGGAAAARRAAQRRSPGPRGPAAGWVSRERPDRPLEIFPAVLGGTAVPLWLEEGVTFLRLRGEMGRTRQGGEKGRDDLGVRRGTGEYGRPGGGGKVQGRRAGEDASSGTATLCLSVRGRCSGPAQQGRQHSRLDGRTAQLRLRGELGKQRGEFKNSPLCISAAVIVSSA